jgi:hypothetical protein
MTTPEQSWPLDTEARRQAYHDLLTCLRGIQQHARPTGKYQAVNHSSIHSLLAVALPLVRRLQAEEREAPDHRVHCRREANGKGASQRPFAWCRVCRRRRFVFCTTVRGICCWECFARAATTNQPTERRPGHGF